MNLISFFIGFCSGLITAGGIVALLTKIKLLTRFANASNTTEHLLIYQSAVLWGATMGNIIFLFPITLDIPFRFILFIILTTAAGLFVGCLGMALAEALNVTAVFNRRMKLHSHLGLIAPAVGLGKLMGSLLFFLTKH